MIDRGETKFGLWNRKKTSTSCGNLINQHGVPGKGCECGPVVVL